MKGIEQFLQVDAATLGALKYAGTWNASTNTPTLASGVGVQGQYYVVSVAGSTNLDGETNWQVGDWAVFNGSVWQKVDGGSTGLLTTLTVTGNTFLATTSGDVGIGTSSPASKLHVEGANGTTARIKSNTGTTGNYAQLLLDSYNNFSGTGQAYVRGVSSASGNSNTDLTFGVNASGFGAPYEAMRLDSAGTIGLGVTPSAWNTVSAFQAKNGSFYGFLEDESAWQQNAYYASGWKYISTGYAASQYMQIGGQHRWFNAPSGTAGNAISFTQAMTLDASGDFIVGGTTTNSIRLTAEKSNPTRGIIAHVVNSGSSSLTGSQIMFTQNTVNNWAVGQPAGVDAFAFWSGRNTAADGTERMRIDSSGRLLVGTSSAAAQTPSGSIQYAVGAHLTSGGFGRFWVPGQQIGSATFAGLYGLATTYNAYYSGGWKSIGGGTGGAITIDEGIFAFSNTNSVGAADQPLTWTNRLVIDASGNLGLGVTPSAWVTAVPAIQLGSAGAFLAAQEASTNVRMGVNAYYNGGWIYTINGAASMYQQAAGVHSWYNAPSGTAGNAISFTQAMTLDASGSLGVGVTNPDAPVTIQANSGANAIRIRGRATGNLSYLVFRNNANSADLGVIGSGDVGITFDYGGTERARITSGGNLLVGTTTENSGNGGLKVNGQFALASQQGVTGSATVNDSAYYVVCYSLSGTCTLTLPTPANNTGRLLNIVVQSAQQVVSASSNVAKITDGSLTTDILPATAGKWAQLWCDGTYWNIIATNV